MNRMKFEGRMNEFMLTAIRVSKDENGMTSERDLKAVMLMKEIIGYAKELNFEVEELKKEVKTLKRELNGRERIGA